MRNKKTIIVAITEYYVNNLNLIPCRFDVGGDTEYIIHHDPIIEQVNKDGKFEVITNFDYHIDFTYYVNEDYLPYVKDKYIPFIRGSKRKQYGQFMNFKRSGDYKLIMPRLFNKRTNHSSLHHGLDKCGTPDCSYVVIKHCHGARGMNHILAPSNMLSSILRDSSRTIAELRQAFPDLIFSDVSDEEAKPFEDDTQYVVTEYLNNIKAEYRLLISGPDIYIRPREIHGEGYRQGSLKSDVYPYITPVEYKSIKLVLDEWLCDELYAFIDYLKFPNGSMDLFETTDGEWGLFEWSHQYAHHGADPKWIADFQKAAIDHIIQNAEVYQNRRL